jgi:hypothetical protein
MIKKVDQQHLINENHHILLKDCNESLATLVNIFQELVDLFNFLFFERYPD